jgi:hypothetical protein
MKTGTHEEEFQAISAIFGDTTLHHTPHSTTHHPTPHPQPGETTTSDHQRHSGSHHSSVAQTEAQPPPTRDKKGNKVNQKQAINQYLYISLHPYLYKYWLIGFC